MKIRALRFGLCVLALAATAAVARGARQAKAPAAGIEARLTTYLGNYLSYDPASKITVEKGTEKLAGFQAYKVKRTGKYPKLAVDSTVYVSEDGKLFFDGDTLPNPNPRPVQSAADMAWLETRSTQLYRTRVKAILVPQADAGGLKALVLAVETGYGPVRLPGYVTPDGSRFFNGTLWDFQQDPREERKRRIDLSVPRFQGKPDGAVTIVEYADM